MAPIGTDGLPLTPEGDAQRDHAVIRFRRALRFPRFSMAQGERWEFVVYGKNRELLEKIRKGERFDFAGGLCLADDVEIVYVGPCGGCDLDAVFKATDAEIASSLSKAKTCEAVANAKDGLAGTRRLPTLLSPRPVD